MAQSVLIANLDRIPHVWLPMGWPWRNLMGGGDCGAIEDCSLVGHIRRYDVN